MTLVDLEPRHFRLCSSCKRPLPFAERYYTCSVSTCNRTKMTLTFCSVACFQAHVPVVRHREAWAEEQRAPTRERFLADRAPQSPEHTQQAPGAARSTPSGTPDASGARDAPAARKPILEEKPAMSNEASSEVANEVLVVVSKVKAYIRARSGMNTSDSVTETISDLVRAACDQAIEKAKSDGRKTVMARDFEGGA